MRSGQKRRYTFTNEKEKLEFESATAAREYFDKYHFNFPVDYIGKIWHGWKVEAEPYTRCKRAAQRL